MKSGFTMRCFSAASVAVLLFGASTVRAAEEEDFGSLVKRLQLEKPTFDKRHKDLLALRYDLSDRPAAASRCRAASPCRKECAPGCPMA